MAHGFAINRMKAMIIDTGSLLYSKVPNTPATRYKNTSSADEAIIPTQAYTVKIKIGVIFLSLLLKLHRSYVNLWT